MVASFEVAWTGGRAPILGLGRFVSLLGDASRGGLALLGNRISTRLEPASRSRFRARPFAFPSRSLVPAELRTRRGARKRSVPWRRRRVALGAACHLTERLEWRGLARSELPAFDVPGPHDARPRSDRGIRERRRPGRSSEVGPVPWVRWGAQAAARLGRVAHAEELADGSAQAAVADGLGIRSSQAQCLESADRCSRESHHPHVHVRPGVDHDHCLVLGRRPSIRRKEHAGSCKRKQQPEYEPHQTCGGSRPPELPAGTSTGQHRAVSRKRPSVTPEQGCPSYQQGRSRRLRAHGRELQPAGRPGPLVASPERRGGE